MTTRLSRSEPALKRTRRHSYRLSFDWLEDRTLPSGVSFLNLAESNDLVVPDRTRVQVMLINAEVVEGTAGLVALAPVAWNEQLRYAHPTGNFAGWTDASDRAYIDCASQAACNDLLIGSRLFQFNRPATSGQALTGDLIRKVNFETGVTEQVFRATDTWNSQTYSTWLNGLMDPEDAVFVGHFRQQTTLEALFFNRTTYASGTIAFRVMDLTTGAITFTWYHNGSSLGGWIDSTDEAFLSDDNADGYDDVVTVNRVPNPEDYRDTSTGFIGIIKIAGQQDGGNAGFSKFYAWDAADGAFSGYDHINDRASGGWVRNNNVYKGVIMLGNPSSATGAAFSIMEPRPGNTFQFIGTVFHGPTNAGSFDLDDTFFMMDYDGDNSDEVVSYSRAAGQQHMKVFQPFSGAVLSQMFPTTPPYDDTGNQWIHPELVTLSFAPDGTNLVLYPSSSLFANLNARYPTATWQNQFLLAAQTWAEQTNLNFAKVTDDASAYGSGAYQQGATTFGDIRIGGYGSAEGWSGSAAYPNPVCQTSIAGDQWYNMSHPFFQSSYVTDWLDTAIHEFGHSLGLGHSGNPDNVMYPNQGEKYFHTDDIAGIRAIYSNGQPRSKDAYDAATPNDTFAAAVDVTSFIDLVTKKALVTGLDITNRTDVDYFKVTAPIGTNNTIRFRVQSNGLSLLSPTISVYDVNQNLIQTISGAGQYGTTLTVVYSSGVAGQVFYIKVAGAESSPFGTGGYALALNFATGTTPAAPSPNTQTANGSGGSCPGGSANEGGEEDHDPAGSEAGQTSPTPTIVAPIAAVPDNSAQQLAVLASRANGSARLAPISIQPATLRPSSFVFVGGVTPETHADLPTKPLNAGGIGSNASVDLDTSADSSSTPASAPATPSSKQSVSDSARWEAVDAILEEVLTDDPAAVELIDTPLPAEEMPSATPAAKLQPADSVWALAIVFASLFGLPALEPRLLTGNPKHEIRNPKQSQNPKS